MLHWRITFVVVGLGAILGTTSGQAWERELWEDCLPASDAEGGCWVRPEAAVLVRGPTLAESRFRMKCPDGQTYSGVIESTRFDRPDRFVSKGYLEGLPFSECLFLVERGRVAGMIAPRPDVRIRLLPVDDAIPRCRLTVRSLADVPPGSSLPPDVRRLGPSRQAPRQTAPRSTAQRDNLSPHAATPAVTPANGAAYPLIDVLIVYTPNAKTVVGGSTGINYVANLAIELANDAYQRSLCTQRLRLVHLAQVQYYESGSAQTDLEALTRPADGVMDQVITWRRDYRADLVHLFLAQADLGDLGWLNNFSTFNETWTFSVSVVSLVETDTFTRAVGSNMGLDHDWYPPPHQTPYPYSFGYAFTGSSGVRWGTLMSNQGMQRIRLHSNPNVLWDGVPAGQPLTSATPAYAALSLNNTATTIEAIFDSTIVPPPVINSPTTASGTVGVPFEYQITATNGPTSYGAAGLPLGLSVNTSSGLISGTPRQAGVYAVELSASNAGGTGVKILTLIIDEPSDCPLQRLARRLRPLGWLPPGFAGISAEQLLQSARRFRDDGLRLSPEGQSLIAAYERHGRTVWQELLQDHELLQALSMAWLELAPIVDEHTVVGSLRLSLAQKRRIENLLARCEAKLAGSAAARELLETCRTWLSRQTVLREDLSAR